MATVSSADTRGLWAGFLAGPVAWAVQLQSGYTLAAWQCDNGPHWPLHLASLVCLLAATGGGYLAWGHWRAVGGWPSGTDEPTGGRVRLMAVLGMMTAVLFSLVIVAQWVALMVLPCGYEVQA